MVTQPFAEELKGLAAHGLGEVERRVQEVCDGWKDERWEARFALSRASAFLGCLSHWPNFRHFFLAFFKGVQALNTFDGLTCDKQSSVQG